MAGSDGPLFAVNLADCRWMLTASANGRVAVRMAHRYGAMRLAADLEYLAAGIRRGDVVFDDDAAAGHMRVRPAHEPPAAPTPGTGAAGSSPAVAVA